MNIRRYILSLLLLCSCLAAVAAPDVRCVVRQDGAVVESTDYYSYGTPFTTEGAVQPYKYGTKELDRMYGLDLYDSQARWHDSLTGRTSTIDPKAEKYYNLSHYTWCAGNPVRFVDPDGNQIFFVQPPPLLSSTNTLLAANKPISVGRIVQSGTKNLTESHHIIPKSLRGLDVVEKAIKQGFKIHGKDNRIELQKFNRQSEVGRHGNHPRYTNKVKEMIKDNGKGGATEKQTIERIIEKIKNDIKNSDSKINDLYSNSFPSDNTFVEVKQI